MRNHRWYIHSRLTAIVFRLPPHTRQTVADLLRAELRAACYDALTSGTTPETLVTDLRSRTVNLRADTSAPLCRTARPIRCDAATVRWRRTGRRR